MSSNIKCQINNVTAARAYLGRGLIYAGRKTRELANNLTTWLIKSDYMLGRKAGFTSLDAMLKKIPASSFGPLSRTAFIAMKGTEKTVDARLNAPRTPIEIKKFRNGESYVRVLETVRGKDVVIFQDFSDGNINDKLMETCLAIDSASRASARSVRLVASSIPYIDDEKGTPNYEIDFLKLMINVLFKAANVDEIRVGSVLLNKENLKLVQDRIVSGEIAPYLITKGERLSGRAGDAPRECVALAGDESIARAYHFIDALSSKNGIDVNMFGSCFDKKADGKFDFREEMNGITFKGKTAYIFKSCDTGTVNDDLVEALLMAYTAKKKGAKEIVLIMPYLPYDRQERKSKPREPISAKFVIEALTAAGVNQIITLDLHAPATQGFTKMPMQNITAFHLISSYLAGRMKAGKMMKGMKAVAPDAGRAKTVEKFSKMTRGMSPDFAVIDKRRIDAGEAKAGAIIGNVAGSEVVIIDDMIDSGGTILTAVDALHENGASAINVAAVHGVLSNVTIKFKDRHGRKNEKALEEYMNIRRFLLSNDRDPDRYLSYDEEGFTVNAFIRMQAEPRIKKLIFTNSIEIPEHHIIDRDRVRIIPIEHLLYVILSRITEGKSLQDYQSEAL